MKKSVHYSEITITIREDKYSSGFPVGLKKGLVDALCVKPEDIKCRQYTREVDEICTLRDYMKTYSVGAYHHFAFKVMGADIDVIGIEDFERIYNPKILDDYLVVDAIQQEFGVDCTNYECCHHLTIQKAGS